MFLQTLPIKRTLKKVLRPVWSYFPQSKLCSHAFPTDVFNELRHALKIDELVQVLIDDDGNFFVIIAVIVINVINDDDDSVVESIGVILPQGVCFPSSHISTIHAISLRV